MDAIQLEFEWDADGMLMKIESQHGRSVDGILMKYGWNTNRL